MNAEGPDPRRNGAGGVRTDGHYSAAAPADPERRLAGRVSRLDRVTLQLGVAVPVVADGPAIYGMFRIVSRSRRGAKGAGYGWLLVMCGTVASIGGNVAHAQPNLVAQLIAAAIPLAVLAMLEGLKGDAGEVARLTHAAGLDCATAPRQLQESTTVRRTTTPAIETAAVADGSRRPALPPSQPDRTTVGARLQVAYGKGRPDGQSWTARTLAEAAGCGRSSAAAFLQRQRPPATEPPP